MGGGYGNQLGQRNYDLTKGRNIHGITTISILYTTTYCMYGLGDILQDDTYVQSTRDYQIDGS